jgi:hypothetical protein
MLFTQCCDCLCMSHLKYKSYTYFHFLSAKLICFFRMCKKKYFINFIIYTTQHFLQLRNRAMLHCDMVQFVLHICKCTRTQYVMQHLVPVFARWLLDKKITKKFVFFKINMYFCKQMTLFIRLNLLPKH